MSANYIYNETLGGTIDGVNTVFTTLSLIGNVEDVYLGWVPYRDITFVIWTNIITFDDAPTIGMAQPTVDYFVWVNNGVSGDVTFWDMIDDTYAKIWSVRTSGVYNEDQVKRQINKGYKRTRNIKSNRETSLQYTFNKAIDSEAIGFSATTVTITAADYIPASGAIMLWDSSLSLYTAYSAGVFTTSAWYVYAGGDRVAIWYKIPTGVKKPSEVIVDRQPLTYSDNREFINVPWNSTYTIFKVADGCEYIFLPYSATNKIVTVKYVPEYDVFVDDIDIVNIEYEYSDVLSLYAAYNILMLREDDRWQAVKQEYLEMLRDYKAYKSMAVDGINNQFRTTSLVKGRRGRTLSSFK